MNHATMPHRERPTTQTRICLLRAVLIAMFVGTVLVLINHGDHITSAASCPGCAVKCAASYLVPFIVSLGSAMLANRGRTRSR